MFISHKAYISPTKIYENKIYAQLSV